MTQEHKPEQLLIPEEIRGLYLDASRVSAAELDWIEPTGEPDEIASLQPQESDTHHPSKLPNIIFAAAIAAGSVGGAAGFRPNVVYAAPEGETTVTANQENQKTFNQFFGNLSTGNEQMRTYDEMLGQEDKMEKYLEATYSADRQRFSEIETTVQNGAKQSTLTGGTTKALYDLVKTSPNTAAQTTPTTLDVFNEVIQNQKFKVIDGKDENILPPEMLDSLPGGTILMWLPENKLPVIYVSTSLRDNNQTRYAVGNNKVAELKQITAKYGNPYVVIPVTKDHTSATPSQTERQISLPDMSVVVKQVDVMTASAKQSAERTIQPLAEKIRPQQSLLAKISSSNTGVKTEQKPSGTEPAKPADAKEAKVSSRIAPSQEPAKGPVVPDIAAKVEDPKASQMALASAQPKPPSSGSEAAKIVLVDSRIAKAAPRLAQALGAAKEPVVPDITAKVEEPAKDKALALAQPQKPSAAPETVKNGKTDTGLPQAEVQASAPTAIIQGPDPSSQSDRTVSARGNGNVPAEAKANGENQQDQSGRTGQGTEASPALAVIVAAPPEIPITGSDTGNGSDPSNKPKEGQDTVLPATDPNDDKTKNGNGNGNGISDTDTQPRESGSTPKSESEKPAVIETPVDPVVSTPEPVASPTVEVPADTPTPAATVTPGPDVSPTPAPTQTPGATTTPAGSIDRPTPVATATPSPETSPTPKATQKPVPTPTSIPTFQHEGRTQAEYKKELAVLEKLKTFNEEQMTQYFIDKYFSKFSGSVSKFYPDRDYQEKFIREIIIDTAKKIAEADKSNPDVPWQIFAVGIGYGIVPESNYDPLAVSWAGCIGLIQACNTESARIVPNLVNPYNDEHGTNYTFSEPEVYAMHKEKYGRIRPDLLPETDIAVQDPITQGKVMLQPYLLRRLEDKNLYNADETLIPIYIRICIFGPAGVGKDWDYVIYPIGSGAYKGNSSGDVIRGEDNPGITNGDTSAYTHKKVDDRYPDPSNVK